MEINISLEHAILKICYRYVVAGVSIYTKQLL